MKFKVGDKVKHRLAGEEMIVIGEDVREALVFYRRYNANKDEFEKVGFKQEELEPVEEK